MTQQMPEPLPPATTDMTGKVALVTGAASGLGRVTAQRLAAAGASLWLVDVNANGLAETAALLNTKPKRGWWTSPIPRPARGRWPTPSVRPARRAVQRGRRHLHGERAGDAVSAAFLSTSCPGGIQL